MADINNINIDTNNYTIDILEQPSYEILLNGQGPQGARGYTGNGISNIELTSTSGNIDTYTITYTDGQTSTFNVTNGVDGQSTSIVSVSASVDENIGTPSVTVTEGGTVTEKTLDFEFSNLKGQPGDAATISVGSVTTGEPGTSATVVNSGTSSAAVFDFTIPKGAKGDTGDTGSTGPQGVSVTGVTLQSTVGLNKTYRMSFSDGTYFDYVVSDGADGGYTLPVASASTLGGIKVGSNLSIDANGVLSAATGGTVDQTYSPTSQNAQSGVAINGAGFLTSITSSDVTTALGYTPYNSSNPNGYTSNVGTVTSVNNVQPVNGNVTISIPTVPTNISAFTNDSGFITSSAISDMQTTTNLVTSISDTSTDTQYPSAKCVYDEIQTVKRNIGEIIQSTLPLTDAGLHLLDGTLLQYGIYQEFIDYIADLYTANPTANYFTDETTWQNSVTQYGSCGKFVYDSTNQTVRLPKVSDILQGTTDVNALGSLMKAGLPNIKNEFNGGRIYTTNDYNSGVVAPFIKAPTPSYLPATTSGTANQTNIIGFDASLSSPIYGNSSTVQPQTIKVLYYIVIANSTKTEIQSDIDEIATDLNGKAGTDLSNVTKTGKVLMSGMGMPSTKAFSFTVGATGSSVTMPANGWLVMRGRASAANQYISLKVLGGSSYREEERRALNADNWITILFPVNAGDSITYYYTVEIFQFQLIYAQGSKN